MCVCVYTETHTHIFTTNVNIKFTNEDTVTFRMQFQKSSNKLLPREKPKHNGTHTLKAKSGKNEIPGNFKKYFYLFINFILLGLSCGMWNFRSSL